jgi:hypothetical protein
MTQDNSVTISLSKYEAIVLFDWLECNTPNSNIFVDEKIFQILSNIESSIEKIIEEPFMDNYKDLVLEARSKI